MSEALNKIKSLIENSKSFGIFLGQNFEEHEFLLKEILEQIISMKNLPVLSFPNDAAPQKEKWATVLKERPTVFIPQKSSIMLPKDKYQIKELSYEEDDKYFSLVFTPQNGGLNKEDIIVSNMLPQVDMAFCFFENEEKTEFFKDKVRMPSRERIIFVCAGEKTLTEKVFSIAGIFDPNFLRDKSLATLFYVALLKETASFSEKAGKEPLSLGSLFLENGADRKAVEAILEKEKSLFFAQLVGRTLARTYVDGVLKTSWSFLNQRDIQKTNQASLSDTPAYFYDILKKIRTMLPPQKLYILLWQSLSGVRAVLTGPFGGSEAYLAPFAHKLGVEMNSRFFVAGPFENFSLAEAKLRQELKDLR